MNLASNNTESHGIDWPIASWMLVVHLLAVLALFHFSWGGFVTFLIMNFMTGCLGITFCFHRLLSHRTFKAHRIVEGFTALCGTLALQGTVRQWVAHHRLHHRHSDDMQDPHNARRGFWFSHIGWLLIRQPKLHDENVLNRLTKDLQNDPWLRFLSRPLVMVAVQVLFGLGLLALGSWSWVLWGVFFRLAFTYHATWFVNSATHRWGYRRFESNDLSRNNWWVALLTWGEGWHNNHHRFGNVCPTCYRWWEIDVTYWLIKSMSWLGLTSDIRGFPSHASAEARGTEHTVGTSIDPVLPLRSHA